MNVPDYSLIDRQEILRELFFPMYSSSPAPEGARDLTVTVEDGVTLHCRFFVVDPGLPTVLFFHGNGETGSDYDDIAPVFGRAGCNFFIMDYRGYGKSTGRPDFATMLADAHPILDACKNAVAESCTNSRLFVMGRSLGSHPAAELAGRRQGDLDGLIICSGFATLEHRWRTLSGVVEAAILEPTVKAHFAKLESISIPTLVLHGERDMLVPPEAAHSFVDAISAASKTLVMIPMAGHNDVMIIDPQLYFGSILRFLRNPEGAGRTAD